MIPLHDNNPTTLKPYVTITLIASCTLVFLWQLSLGPGGERILFSLGVIPSALLGYKVLVPSLVMVPPAITIFYFDVPIRRMDAPYRQYALFVDFWE